MTQSCVSTEHDSITIKRERGLKKSIKEMFYINTRERRLIFERRHLI